MTHLLDTSAVLALMFDEPGADRVEALLEDPDAFVCISVLTLFEVYTASLHRTGSTTMAQGLVDETVASVEAVLGVAAEIVKEGMELRALASARIATVDTLIAATASHLGVTLVHRDPHFASLPIGRPPQEALPAKRNDVV